MAFAIIENLKGFITSRPPLIIFMICLASFAVALITFAYIVKVKELPRNELSENWNTFLESFSEVEFCVLSNSSDYVIEPLSTQKSVKDVQPADVTSTLRPDTIVNVSVSMMVVMSPTVEFVSIPHNITHITTSLTGEQLGLSGDAADLDLNMTLLLPFQWNTTHCDSKGLCEPVKIPTCVSFQAPISIFPRTRMPSSCQAVNDSGLEYHVKMIGTRQPDFVWCRSKPVLRVQHNLDPTLTMMLSLHDKSVINLHLLHTSYFLFIMVITLFCYAIVKGRPPKTKIVQYVPAEKVPMTA